MNLNEMFILLTGVSFIVPFQLDKVVKEKEAQFLEEKNNLWKELTDGFQKVFFFYSQSFDILG